MRILLIEDDSATAQSIELMLKSEGMNVYTTDLGEEGVDLATAYDYSLILLDLNLPDMHGLDVLRVLRARKVATPVMIVSGTTDIEMKVKTFSAGADDYLGKPFHKDELVVRIHAIVRRAGGQPLSSIVTGSLTVHLDRRKATVGTQQLELTGREYQLLELLALRKLGVVSKRECMTHLYNGMAPPEEKVVDVYVCKLRKKIAAANGGVHYIDTVWGVGYKLVDPEPVPA